MYVHKVLPWTEIRAAHEEMEGNKNSGKIIVEVQ
jgi:NADPH:quinone reductase-like Zn-dependent oxidoreductase